MSGKLYISAAHKSSGKTVISTGLCRALSDTGTSVQAFKKGPDYIDPLWLSSATGRSCWNLDFNTQQNEEITALFSHMAHGKNLALVEGNKGLHDGTAFDGSNSNAAMARLLDAPVVLIVDTRGMTRGVAPLVIGMSQFDSDVRIAGIILNQVGGSRHEGKLRGVLEHYTDFPVIGAVHKNPALSIDERHLGLIPSNEARDAEQFIQNAATAVREQIDLDGLMRSAAPTATEPATAKRSANPSPVTIAIARDEAFGFYYADDLEAFERCGARCVFFDSLHDHVLPACDGLFIGGGFPETRLAELQANTSLRHSIRKALATGLPAYAECGGLMYLSEEIRWGEDRAEGVGIIPGRVEMSRRPVGRGYVRLTATEQHPWGTDTPPADQHLAEAELQAHEFHHSRLILGPDECRFAYRVNRGHGIDGNNDGIIVNNLLANYAHLRSTAHNQWVERFLAFVRRTNIPWDPQTTSVQTT